MKKTPSVNDILWTHLCIGGKNASLIRNHFSWLGNIDYLSVLGEFFEPDDDWDRLEFARELAHLYLLRYDMEFILPLWELVSIFEQERNISFEKQRDHTIHSLYLYLLGLWFFDHSTRFQKIYKLFHVAEKERDEYIKYFSFQWIYAGLLHDIGYVFENFKNNKLNIGKKIDYYFRKDNLKYMFPKASDELLSNVWGKAKKKIDGWLSTDEFPCYSNSSTPDDIIRELNKIPWLPDIDTSWPDRISKAFDKCRLTGKSSSRLYHKPRGKMIYEYTKQIASCGYGKSNEGAIDHGYASGCLLFQLISFKFWLATKWIKKCMIGIDGRPNVEDNLDFLVRYILPACHAAAAHNILKKEIDGNKILPIKISDSPLLFFSILCDELQKWHRPPIGIIYTSGKKVYLRPKEKDIFFEIVADDYSEYILINYKKKTVYEEIYKNLSRLNYNDINSLLSFGGYGFKLEMDRKIRDILRSKERKSMKNNA